MDGWIFLELHLNFRALSLQELSPSVWSVVGSRRSPSTVPCGTPYKLRRGTEPEAFSRSTKHSWSGPRVVVFLGVVTGEDPVREQDQRPSAQASLLTPWSGLSWGAEKVESLNIQDLLHSWSSAASELQSSFPPSDNIFSPGQPFPTRTRHSLQTVSLNLLESSSVASLNSSHPPDHPAKCSRCLQGQPGPAVLLLQPDR